MSIFNTINISASGIYAQKKRLDIVAQNLANADTILTNTEEPYRRKVAVLASVRNPKSFRSILDNASYSKKGFGVTVSAVNANSEPFKLMYNPDHPLASEDGYVRMPNVDTTVEMLEMLAATRAYEANVTVMNNAKAMFTKALEIGGR